MLTLAHLRLLELLDAAAAAAEGNERQRRGGRKQPVESYTCGLPDT